MQRLKPIWVVLALVAFCLTAIPAMADPAADAKAMVDQAIKMYAEKGKDATFAAIRDPKGSFRKGELYIFVGDINKISNVVHPVNPKLENRDFAKLKDIKGKMFFLEFVNTAKGSGEGFVEYWWPKPGEKTASLKSTFVKRVPKTDFFMACGFYK